MPLPQMHGRTHCPGGSDPIPCLPGPWARRSRSFGATNQTVTNNSTTDLVPDTDYNMTGSDSGVGFFEPETGGAANGIKILLKGIFLIKVGIFWAEGFNSMMGVGYQDTIAGGGHWIGMMHQTSQQLWYEGSWVARLPANAVVKASFYQLTGSDKHIDAATLEIVRMSSYTGTEISAMDPDQ